MQHGHTPCWSPTKAGSPKATGELWPDGTLRPAIEDGFGAGAIAGVLAAADRSLSPEAGAMGASVPPAEHLHEVLMQASSGRELTAAGWSLDIEVAAALDVSRTVPTMGEDGMFRRRT